MNENTIIVIFGASGDLTHRKLIPALYSLYVKKRMPDKWRIVGVSRSTFSDDEFRQNMESGVKEFANDKYNAGLWQKFAANVT
ncbi:MAG: glucose-6-phosphate dehydrogenase, partial [Anaerolineales bacterium]|nr:glucose-6-phosphate dehydrogenase [Anaerolineales bacterium]